MPTVPPHTHREFRRSAKANSSWFPYIYQGTNVSVDPGPGGITINVGGGNVRTIAVSKVDADGGQRVPTLLQAGDTVTLTDDPDTPPITGWVRYVLTEDPVDQGTWVTAQALRTDQIGSTNPPPVGARLRVYSTWSASGSYYLTGPEGDARYVNESGDSMTGNLDAQGTVLGKIWGGSYYGVSNTDTGTDTASLLLGNASKAGASYLIGNPGSSVNIRPAAGSSGADHQFTSAGLVLPISPTDGSHATRKDYVDAQVGTRMLRDSQTITDWNSPGANQFLMASGAANAPSSTKAGWWYGWQVVHNTSWITQFAMPFAQNGIDGAALQARHKENGVWGAWYRVVNYSALSWDTLDNFIFIRHGGNSASATTSAQSVWAIGNKKDSGSAGVTANEEFRIQWYNTAGTYAGKPIYIRASDGVVRMPNNGGAVPSLLSAPTTPIEDDVVMNASSVVDLVANIIEVLGLLPSPRAAGSPTLSEEIRTALNIVHVSPTP